MRRPERAGVPASLRLAAGVSALLAAAAARADGEPLLADIIVTAEKRTENRQSVPASVQALDVQTLTELQVTSFDGYAKFLPSLSSQNWGTGRENLFIRGVTNGTDGFRLGSQPPVAVYLDEQPVTTIYNNLDVHVYDIARIEELSGPQGTLYGSSAMSGTLRIITNKPDPARFAAGYDLNANTVAGAAGGQVEGFVNLPLGAHAAVRLVAFDEHDGGWVNNVVGPPLYFPTSGVTLSNAALARRNYNDTETGGGRAALRVELSDSWTVTPSVMHQQQTANGIPAFEPALGDLNVARYNPEGNEDRWTQAALTVQGRLARLDVTYAGAYLDRAVDSAADYSEYMADYDVAYAAQPAYWGDRYLDNAGHPVAPNARGLTHIGMTKWSNELRVAAPREWPVRFVAGLFVARQGSDFLNRDQIPGLGTSSSITGQPGVYYLNSITRVDRDRAAFGEVTIDLAPRLALTAGLREFGYDNSVYGFFGYNASYPSGEALCAPGSSAIAGPDRPCIDVDTRATGTGSTYRLTLSGQLDADRLVYATWSTGFRPGGINRTHDVGPFRPDSLVNLEAGFKSEWLQHRLRFNASLFFERWKNPQYAICGPYCIFEVINAGGAEIRGAEGEVRFAPVGGLTISAAATWLDAKLTKDACRYGSAGALCNDAAGAPDPSVAPVASAGTPLPVARAKGNLVIRYEHPLGPLTAYGQFAGVGQSEVHSQAPVSPGTLPTGNPPGYVSIDLTTGVRRGHWEAELYATNALDNRGQQLRARTCFVAPCTQLYVGPIPPRTVGAYLRERW